MMLFERKEGILNEKVSMWLGFFKLGDSFPEGLISK